MSDIAKKTAKDGPQLENHASAPGEGGPTTQENHASGSELSTQENHASGEGAQ
ncbi:sigma-like protein [Streptomyces sp. TRM43335]|uniref:Sigma-like protein n=1 Tax=Streptomyces taklimakanensis TaxID=2569853 RepID=A0A6G2BBT6_9ACTN|nr:sigma-like protein [Streptomyces taklimakanensis]MTE19523.1 sigma-like protein [Streptomyces taklimakanensis]